VHVDPLGVVRLESGAQLGKVDRVGVGNREDQVRVADVDGRPTVRTPAAVSTCRIASLLPAARSSAWPRQRMPLPEISASDPSEFNRTMHASWSASDGARP
jgi:hypothetical protein